MPGGDVWGSDRDATSTLVVIFGWLGAAFSIVLIVSPIPTFRGIIRKRDVAGFDHKPYVCAVANCAVWLAYAAVTPQRLQTLVTNVVGITLELAYCAIFARFEGKAEGRWKKRCARDLALSLFLVAVIAVVGVVIEPFGVDPTLYFGVWSAVITLLMLGSPLLATRQVIRTRSVEFMPLPLTLSVFLCSASWTIYAVPLGDPIIFAPFFGGFLLALAQLALYTTFSSSLKHQRTTQDTGSEAGVNLVDDDDDDEESRTRPLLT